MSIAAQEMTVSPDALLEMVSRLSDADLDLFLDQALLIRARRRAPSLSGRETELFLVINRCRPPEAQARFGYLTKRLRSSRMTRKENAEFLTMTDEDEQQAAERVEAVTDLAALRDVTFSEMWKQLKLGPPLSG